MSYKLSNQLDADAVTSFELYRKYFELNKYHFPKSVIRLVKSSDWNGGTMQKGPMDSRLIKTTLLHSKSEIQFELEKRQSGDKLIIKYSGVQSFDLRRKFTEELIWRYEQFRFVNSYNKYKLQDKIFIHDIEWTSGEIFKIEAKEISVQYIEK